MDGVPSDGGISALARCEEKEKHAFLKGVLPREGGGLPMNNFRDVNTLVSPEGGWPN